MRNFTGLIFFLYNKVGFLYTFVFRRVDIVFSKLPVLCILFPYKILEMNPHLDSKSNVCPKSFFSFVLPFLFFKWNPLTAMCINLPFYQYSWIFAAINMMVNLVRSNLYFF